MGLAHTELGLASCLEHLDEDPAQAIQVEKKCSKWHLGASDNGKFSVSLLFGRCFMVSKSISFSCCLGAI